MCTPSQAAASQRSCLRSDKWILLIALLWFLGFLAFVILVYTKCVTLLPATCQPLGAGFCNVSVTPKNGDEPFTIYCNRARSALRASSQNETKREETECFYRTGYCKVLKYDSNKLYGWGKFALAILQMLVIYVAATPVLSLILALPYVAIRACFKKCQREKSNGTV